MLMPARTNHNGKAGVGLNVFVVLCDITISLILCLSVSMVFQQTLAKVPPETSRALGESRILLEKSAALPSGTLWEVQPGLDSVLVRLQTDALFQVDKAAYTKGAEATIDRLATALEPVLSKHSSGSGRVLEVQVQGHTDCTENKSDEEEYIQLAYDRAEAVRRQIVDPRPTEGSDGSTQLTEGPLQAYAYLFSVAAYGYHRPVVDPRKYDRRGSPPCRRIDIKIVFDNPSLKGREQSVMLPMDENYKLH